MKIYVDFCEPKSKWKLPSAKYFIPAVTILTLLICAIFAHAQTPQPAYLTASWYSIQSLKREGTYAYSKGQMANGEYFRDDNYTCATRDFPLGTNLRVTNRDSGKSVYVKVTDRINKRFAGKRIDLSKRAFSQIANCKQGIVSVVVEVVR
jgi:rare lipoprotein A (peptidoglycan hydrolase)